MVNLAPKNGVEAGKFLKGQHDTNASDWFRKCLVLQRTARDIPAVYPSAYSAMLATPESERITNRDNFKRGMVGYSKGSDPAGHIYYIAGRNIQGEILAWTNDKRNDRNTERGWVDIVPLSFFEEEWGHQIQFAATWLNGYDFADFNKAPVAQRGSLGSNYRHGINDLEKALENHREHGHKDIVEVLERDLVRMKKHLHKFS